MIVLIVTIVCLVVGAAFGYGIALVNVDRSLAAMSDEELKALGDRVAARRHPKTEVR